MWYPLNKSIKRLWLTSLALVVLLAVGGPAEPPEQAAAAAPVEHSLLHTVDVLSRHLLIEDTAKHRRATLALREAAKALAAQLGAPSMAQADESEASENEATAARRQLRRKTMPFFSFAALIPRTVEPGA